MKTKKQGFEENYSRLMNETSERIKSLGLNLSSKVVEDWPPPESVNVRQFKIVKHDELYLDITPWIRNNNFGFDVILHHSGQRDPIGKIMWMMGEDCFCFRPSGDKLEDKEWRSWLMLLHQYDAERAVRIVERAQQRQC